MRITRPRLLLGALILTLIYWIPAFWFADQARSAVNAAYFLLAMMTSFLLLPDVIDVFRTDADGMRWQVVFAKLGIFLLAASFTLSRAWGLFISYQGYPDDLLHSPTGGYFVYVQGLGLGGIFLGLSNPGTVSPNLSARSAVIIACACGIVIGIALGRVPIPAA